MRPLATLSTTALRHLPRPIWRRALVLFSAGLLACGGTGANQPVVIVRVEVAGCALPVEPGDHCAVTAIPYSAAGRASGGVTWESADPAIATVSVSGAVTGIAEGAPGSASSTCPVWPCWLVMVSGVIDTSANGGSASVRDVHDAATEQRIATTTAMKADRIQLLIPLTRAEGFTAGSVVGLEVITEKTPSRRSLVTNISR